jgi:hypothetical protein
MILAIVFLFNVFVLVLCVFCMRTHLRFYPSSFFLWLVAFPTLFAPLTRFVTVRDWMTSATHFFLPLSLSRPTLFSFSSSIHLHSCLPLSIFLQLLLSFFHPPSHYGIVTKASPLTLPFVTRLFSSVITIYFSFLAAQLLCIYLIWLAFLSWLLNHSMLESITFEPIKAAKACILPSCTISMKLLACHNSDSKGRSLQSRAPVELSTEAFTIEHFLLPAVDIGRLRSLLLVFLTSSCYPLVYLLFAALLDDAFALYGQTAYSDETRYRASIFNREAMPNSNLYC